MKLLKKKLSFSHYIPFFYYLLVFFAPLVMNSVTSEIFEFNKMMLIYVTALIVGCLYLAQLVIKPEKFISSFFTIILLLFFISQLLSTIYSIDVLTSLFGYYGRWNGGLVSIAAYIILFFVFIQVLKKDQVIRMLQFSLLSSLIVIVWGLLAAIGLDFSCYIFTGNLSNSCWTAQFDPAERMFSTIGQPNWLGAYLAFHVFIGVYFLYKTIFRDNIKAIKNSLTSPIALAYTSYIVLNVWALFLTKSRSSILAVVVSVILGALMFGGKRLHLKRKTEEIAILSFVALICISFFIGWRTGYIQNFFALPTETTTITDSFDIRKVVWKGAIDLGLMYPYFGSGTETFAYAYYFTRPAAHNLTSEWDFIYNKAHNEYLNYFATTGFVGLSAYMLLIIATFILFWRYYKSENENKDMILVASLMLGYITILVTNFFGFSVSTIQILFYLTPACVVVLMKKQTDYRTFVLQHASHVRKILLIGVFILFCSGGWYLYNYYTADIAYAKARNLMNINEYEDALLLLDEARKKRYEHVYEDKLSYTLANIAFLYSFTEDQERANRYIMLADVANLRTLEQAPHNLLYWRTRGKNYYLFYQINQSEDDLQKALVAFEEVVSIAPTDVQSRYTLALFNWLASQEVDNSEKSSLYYGRALEEIRTVIDMRPNYIEAQELLAEMLVGS